MKKIFVNGLSALQGGGQTYLIHLFQEVPDVEIHLALPDELLGKVPQHPNVVRVHAEFAQRSRLHRLIWENFMLPNYLKAHAVGVYYQPSGTLPWCRIRSSREIIAFRNMLPFAPEESGRFYLGFKRMRYWILRQLLSRDFRRADLVIFISQFAKQVIDKALPSRAGRSMVIYHGLDEKFRSGGPRPMGLPAEYVLYVSILNFYKAQVEVVRAWAEVRKLRPQTREKLVLAGPEYGPYGDLVRGEIQRLDLQKEVVLIPKVPYESLPGYYHHAKINIFASSCENCPNVLLEKLAAGRPVLSSNLEPMPEIAGSGALYFDPYAPEDLCRLILNVIDDPARLAKMGEEARRRSLEYSWPKSRRETWDALLSLNPEA